MTCLIVIEPADIANVVAVTRTNNCVAYNVLSLHCLSGLMACYSYAQTLTIDCI